MRDIRRHGKRDRGGDGLPGGDALPGQPAEDPWPGPGRRIYVNCRWTLAVNLHYYLS